MAIIAPISFKNFQREGDRMSPVQRFLKCLEPSICLRHFECLVAMYVEDQRFLELLVTELREGQHSLFVK